MAFQLALRNLNLQSMLPARGMKSLVGLSLTQSKNMVHDIPIFFFIFLVLKQTNP